MRKLMLGVFLSILVFSIIFGMTGFVKAEDAHSTTGPEPPLSVLAEYNATRCNINNDCVLKDKPYCCGNKTEYYKSCYNVNKSVPEINCTSSAPCPGIAQVDYCRCQDNQCVGKENDSQQNSGCKNLFWFDNENQNCSKKQFCGTYMYLGLQTFETKEKCLKAVEPFRCATDSDCPQQSGYCPSAEKCTKDTTVKCTKDTTVKCIEGKCKIIQKLRNKFLPWQKRNESECPDGCKCRGAVVSCITEDGKTMTIESGNSGKITTIEVNKIKVNTTLEFETSTENNKTKIILNLPDGRNITLKTLPEAALIKVLLKFPQLNNCTATKPMQDCPIQIELKQITITKGNQTKVVYEVIGEKHGKFLGLFKTKGKIITEVDAETGEIVKMKKPWWSFLAGI